MSRLENENKQGGQLEQMQKEMERLKKDLKHKQSRKFFNCGTCLVIIVLFILTLFGFGAYVLAKSGIRQIPVFTAYFYHQPQPVYPVKGQGIDENKIISRLASVASAEALKQRKTKDVTVNFDLSENEISGLLNNQLAKSEKLKTEIELWQIAVKPDFIEFFMKSKNPKNLIVTLHARPEVTDGNLKFKVISFKIGDLSLPKFIGSILIENMGSNVVNSLLNSVSALGQIKAVNLAQGKITLMFLINNLIDLKNAI